MKAIIIDDEPLARSIIKEYLQPYTDIELVEECSDGFAGLKAIQQHQPDLIFLDIQMPKITGFEMLELVDNPPLVIFTTAFEEYAIKAFDAHAADYLLKPFSKERFDKAMQKMLLHKNNMTQAVTDAALQTPTNSNRIVVKDNGKIKIIPLAQLQYIEAADDYVKIFTKDGYSLKKKTMNYFEQSLNTDQFVRVHRSYIVQVQQITKIEALEKDSHIALLKTGIKVPLSKTGYTKLKLVLGL